VPVYAYTIIDLAGQPQSGTLIAETPAAGREQLRERGVAIESFRAAAAKSILFKVPLRSRARRNEQVAEAARYLALLLRAGVPLVESLDVLSRQYTRQIGTVLKEVRDKVAGGEGLADALNRHPDWFDSLFVSAVRMGELSGNLEESLAELSAHLHSRQALSGKLTAALTYPLILTVVGIGVVLFLMSYVIPQLLTVLAASGRPLPASTQVLKTLSDSLLRYWPALLLIAVGCGVLLATLYQRRTTRRILQGGILRLPLLGPLLQKNLVARFAQQLALLLKTGIPFVDAVRHVSAQTKHVVLADELETIADSVNSGSDIAPALEGSRVFPPVVAHVVAVGQDSGELTEMLVELRNRYEDEVRLATTKFATVLEPLLIIVLAAAVGFVVFACLMPILEATRGIA
jgi:type II secretory pathway component PulF